MLKKQVGILFLILAVTGCSSPTVLSPTSTVVLEQVDSQPTLTPELISASTATPLPEATSKPTSIPAIPQPPISNLSVILARVKGGLNSFFVVGGSHNGSWQSPADVVAGTSFEIDFQIFSTFDLEDQISGQEPVLEPICNQYFLNLNMPSLDQSAIGVSGQWDVLPRLPLELSKDAEVHLRAITAWQIEQAPSMPIPLIDKVWMIDIEGNGTEEVFINGTRYAEPTGHNVGPRDYSVVLMRTEIGSELVTKVLVGDYYSEEAENQFPLTYNLEFIGDLNGDGKLEVVVGVSRWEGTGVMVFEIDGIDVQLVLSVMCSL